MQRPSFSPISGPECCSHIAAFLLRAPEPIYVYWLSYLAAFARILLHWLHTLKSPIVVLWLFLSLLYCCILLHISGC